MSGVLATTHDLALMQLPDVEAASNPSHRACEHIERPLSFSDRGPRRLCNTHGPSLERGRLNTRLAPATQHDVHLYKR